MELYLCEWIKGMLYQVFHFVPYTITLNGDNINQMMNGSLQS